MPETYIPLADAAQFEGVKYNTLVQRIKRNPEQYKTQTVAGEGGGKEQIRVAVSSLSQKARRAHRAQQRIDGGDIIIDQIKGQETPWYVTADLNQYIEGHKRQYYEAVELANRVQESLQYDGPDRTGYMKELAEELGIGTATLYRHQKAVAEANAWAERLRREDGFGRSHFRVLAVCRKPKERNTFPGLTPEQRALIENIWFDKRFRNNHGSMVLLWERFEIEAEKRGWTDYPGQKTIERYINYIKELPGAASAMCLAADGKREWKNKKQIKAQRDATCLDVMEYVVGDEHTFDLWVEWTTPQGKKKAVRPVLVGWMDQRSRCIIGDVMCVHANSQTLKESLVKMVHSELGGVPKVLLIDNGKDYTAETMTGQSRKERKIEYADFDTETEGFYRTLRIRRVTRAKPYEPWVKPIERFFGQVCSNFSKRFDSYTGTLTGSKTDAKRKKDIDRMLERGELLTMEEFYGEWKKWLDKYHNKVHTGLKGDQWHTPIEVFRNATRYTEEAAPARSVTAMLLMKGQTVTVRNYGIQKFGTVYTDSELGKYVGEKVQIKWDQDDVRRLYVFRKDGKSICEAVSAELLAFGDKVSQDALERHLAAQKRNEKEIERILAEFTTPYEMRVEQGRPTDAVGKLDLTIKAHRRDNTIAFPQDRKIREQMAAQRRKKDTAAGEEFLASKGAGVFDQLRAMSG